MFKRIGSNVSRLAAFTRQGSCKPNAMELVPIAEVPPRLARFQRAKLRRKFSNKCNHTIK